MIQAGMLSTPIMIFPLLTLVLVSVVSSELYHIVPTDSLSLCVNYTDGSCMTLAQFANNRYVASDDDALTLVFSPGEHTLSQTIRISNIKNVTLIGDSKQPTLDSFGRLQLSNISTVLYIGNLDIRRHGQTVVRIEDVERVFIKNCQITSRNRLLTSQHSFIALYLNRVARSVLISGSKFENNHIQHVAESNSSYYIGGSALWIQESESVTIIDSSFVNNLIRGVNIPVRGGAISLRDIEVAVLVNCTMSNNSIVCYGCQYAIGGAISLFQIYKLAVINSTFVGNGILFSGEYFTDSNHRYGGAIHAQVVTMKVSGSAFHANIAVNGGSIAFMANSKCSFSSSNNSYTNNFASSLGGAVLITSCIATLSNDYYEGNSALIGGAVHTEADSFTTFNTSYTKNLYGKGGAIRAVVPYNGSTYMSKNKFIANFATAGAAIHIEFNGNNYYYSSENQFINNSAILDGGAIFAYVSGSNTTHYSLHNLFIHNVASTASGGAIWLNVSRNVIKYISSYNLFQHNTAELNGGAIKLIYGPELNSDGLFNSSFNTFVSNQARLHGGAVFIQNAVINDVITYHIINNSYIKNSVIEEGGAVYIAAGNAVIDKTMFLNNLAKSGGGSALVFADGTVVLSNCTMLSNQGDLLMFIINSQLLSRDCKISGNFGALFVLNSKLVIDGICTFTDNICKNMGVIKSLQSDIQFKSTAIVTFRGNRARDGGGVFLFESRLIIACHVSIDGNTATNLDGGVYAYRSEIIIKGQNETTVIDNNSALSAGGGMLLVSSILKVLQGTLTARNNTAQYGGALFLGKTSKLYVYYSKSTVHQDIIGKIEVNSNSANTGGGLYIADDSQLLCAIDSSRAVMETECFIQGLTVNEFTNMFPAQLLLSFYNNTAQYEGNDIYGGLLDRCSVSEFAYRATHRGIDYIKAITTFNGKSGMNMSRHELSKHMTSEPVQMCFCTDNKTYDCKIMQKELPAKRGGPFRLLVTAVDQVETQVAATIIALFSNESNIGHFKEEQSQKQIDSVCTELEYNVFSDKEEVLLDFFPLGPCGRLGISKRALKVTFLPCDCPLGFQPSDSKQECVCECATAIKPIANCSDELVTLTSSNDWVGFINDSANSNGLLIHSCPFDYCLERPVNISVSVSNGADMQCAFNRSNLLCGGCKKGLSLVLGSSKCMKCRNEHLALLLPFAFLGILLVALILVLNMTVAVGTINGLIFYANIVGAGQSVFFSGKEIPPIKIFIAWLNLDLGIETCFYDGMTSDAKVLLQLVFPSYLIFLTVIIIVLCEYSQKFAALLGHRNPVATLCTLILLSYSKLLRVIIASLQFTYLSYPDNSSHIIWLYDANVPYFEPSHSVPLFLVSSIIIILGAIYTVLLFFGQWLPRLPNRKMMKWIRHPKYNAFIDAYHAPLSPKHRYWVGLLLLARIVHNLVQALTANRSVTLLTTACVALSLVMLKMINVRTHKNWTVDTLESFFLVQLVVLSIGTYHVGESHGNQLALATTSTSVALTIFAGIVCYHSYKYVLHNTFLWRKIERIFTRRQYREYQLVALVDNDSSSDEEEFEHASIKDEPHNYTENASTVSQERQAKGPLYDPPIIQSALIVDQLREPALDILDPVTAEHYREVIRRRQPNLPPREPTTQFIDRPTQ